MIADLSSVDRGSECRPSLTIQIREHRAIPVEWTSHLARKKQALPLQQEQGGQESSPCVHLTEERSTHDR